MKYFASIIRSFRRNSNSGPFKMTNYHSGDNDKIQPKIKQKHYNRRRCSCVSISFFQNLHSFNSILNLSVRVWVGYIPFIVLKWPSLTFAGIDKSDIFEGRWVSSMLFQHKFPFLIARETFIR